MKDLADLTALVARSADAIERERRLPPELLEALHEGGWFRLLLPKAYGGGESDPVSFVETIADIARHDASTAWCLCQNAVCSMVAAFVAPEVAGEIYGRDPRAVLAGPGLFLIVRYFAGLGGVGVATAGWVIWHIAAGRGGGGFGSRRGPALAAA